MRLPGLYVLPLPIPWLSLCVACYPLLQRVTVLLTLELGLAFELIGYHHPETKRLLSIGRAPAATHKAVLGHRAKQAVRAN